ncbi:hypothetical protein HN51_031988 [Arachis hypogaea]
MQPYVLVGWERTASNSKVFKNTLSRDDSIKLPREKFYLGDARFISFGVLKKRFAIITSDAKPHYDFDIMNEIVLACFILHNFLMGIDPNPHSIA